jgi:hypothetical protein
MEATGKTRMGKLRNCGIKIFELPWLTESYLGANPACLSRILAMEQLFTTELILILCKVELNRRGRGAMGIQWSRIPTVLQDADPDWLGMSDFCYASFTFQGSIMPKS